MLKAKHIEMVLQQWLRPTLQQSYGFKAGLHVTFCLQSCMIRYVWQIRLIQNTRLHYSCFHSVFCSVFPKTPWMKHCLFENKAPARPSFVRSSNLIQCMQNVKSAVHTQRFVWSSGMIMQDWRQHVTCRPAFTALAESCLWTGSASSSPLSR
jgi:hypothetical protein